MPVNRQQRRAQERKKKAIARQIVRLEKPEAYYEGFKDGSASFTEAAYAAFCVAMNELQYTTDDILAVLRRMDDALLLCAGNHEMIQEAFEKTGLLIDFSELFSEDRLQKKEGIA